MEEKDLKIVSGWVSRYFEETLKGDAAGAQKAMQACAGVHYDALKMDELTAPYIGKLEGFISFLENSWKWKVEYDAEKGVIIADEAKDHCVCPLARNGLLRSAGLCACSESLITRVFSRVCGKPVRSEVIQSILRGDTSCVYRVVLA